MSHTGCMRKSPASIFTEASALSFFSAHLDQLKWVYRYSEDRKTIISGFSSSDLLWDFALSAHGHAEGRFLLLVTSHLPCKALPEQRAACAEVLGRLNFELLVGCFEMNHADGRCVEWQMSSAGIKHFGWHG